MNRANSNLTVKQRPIVFMQEIDLNDSQAKKDLQNWKPRQRSRDIFCPSSIPFLSTDTSECPQSGPILTSSPVANNPRSPHKSLSPSFFDRPKENIKTPAQEHVYSEEGSPISTEKHRPSMKNLNDFFVDPEPRPGETFSDSDSSNQTLTSHDFGDLFEDSNIDKFGAVFEQLNRGIADLRRRLTTNPSSRLIFGSKQPPPSANWSLSTSSGGDNPFEARPNRHQINVRPLPPQNHPRSQAYSINTELCANFDCPPTKSSKNSTEACKSLARVYIDRTKDVYKLRIAVRNHEVTDAQRVGDSEMVRRLRAEQNSLADEFNAQKHSIKNHYKHLLALRKDAQSLRHIISELELKIEHAEREANRLCSIIEFYNHKAPKYHSAEKTVQTTERLLQRQTFSEPAAVKNQHQSSYVQTKVERSVLETTLQQMVTQPAMKKTSSSESIVSLVEDDNILEIPELQPPAMKTVSKESSPSQIPPLNFGALHVFESFIRSPLSISDRAQEDRSISTAANTENDVSSIAFDEAADSTIINKQKSDDEEVAPQVENKKKKETSRSTEKTPSKTEEEEPSPPPDREIPMKKAIQESNIEEPREQDEIEMKLNEHIPSPPQEVSASEGVEETKDAMNEESASGRGSGDATSSDSVVSELASSALDNSLDKLDELVVQGREGGGTPKVSSSSATSPATLTPSQKDEHSSVSSLDSLPTASDKSVLKVKSLQISSEVHSSGESP